MTLAGLVIAAGGCGDPDREITGGKGGAGGEISGTGGAGGASNGPTPTTSAQGGAPNVYIPDCAAEVPGSPSNSACPTFWNASHVYNLRYQGVDTTLPSPIGQPPLYSQVNYIHARLFNHGNAYGMGKVKFFYRISGPTGTFLPVPVPPVTVSGVPGGGSLDVSVPWTPAPVPGHTHHYCIAAWYDETGTFGPTLPSVPANTQVGQRNLAGVLLDGSDPFVPTQIENEGATARKSNLVLIAFPGESGETFLDVGRVTLDLLAVFDGWKASGSPGKGVVPADGTAVEMIQAEGATVNLPELEPGDNEPLLFGFFLDKAAVPKESAYGFRLEEYDGDGVLLGGVDYELTVPKP